MIPDRTMEQMNARIVQLVRQLERSQSACEREATAVDLLRAEIERLQEEKDELRSDRDYWYTRAQQAEAGMSDWAFDERGDVDDGRVAG